MKNISLRYSGRSFLVLVLLLFLFLYNFAIIQKERFLSHGDDVILRLAPVDPRSLMQGDYMVLSFAIEAKISSGLRKASGNYLLPSGKGRVVLREYDGEHRFVRLDDGSSLAPGERFLVYRIDTHRKIKIGGGSFFFEEGLSSLYDYARYARLKVDPDGEAIITELLDIDKKTLRKERWDQKTRTLREN